MGDSYGFIFRGKTVDGEATFADESVMPGEQFLAIGAGSHYPEPLIWRRYRNIQNQSYTGGSDRYPDALIFKAKRNVKFTGFMWTKEYNGKDFTIEASWRISDTKNSGEWSESIQISRSKDDIWEDDPLKHELHKVNI